MAAEDTGSGANESPAADLSVTADALTPPVNDGFNKIDPSVDNVSDVDLMRSAKGGETKDAKATDEKADAKAADEKAAAEKAEADAKAELDRFDKHPRFQELIKERDNFEAELAEIKGQLKVLTPQDKKDAEAREDKALPYKDITKLDPDPARNKEMILEWQEDDPVGYAANLYQQMLHESRAQIQAEKDAAQKAAEQTAQQEKVRGTFTKYGKDNPDFLKVFNLETGAIGPELQKVMDENPGIGAIGAHLLMTEKTRIEEAIKEHVDKAVKETEARVTKNFQAKRNAEVIGDGGTVKDSGAIPDELKHPEKYGGRTQALAQRLSRLRQAAMGG